MSSICCTEQNVHQILTKHPLEIYIFTSLNYHQKKKKQNHSKQQVDFRYTAMDPYFISAKKKPKLKNRLGEILDNLLRINMGVCVYIIAS